MAASLNAINVEQEDVGIVFPHSIGMVPSYAKDVQVEPIEFNAILPSVQAAIKFSGDGGARIQLDVSEQDRMQIYKLNELKNMVFRVSIIPLPDEDGGSKGDIEAWSGEL